MKIVIPSAWSQGLQISTTHPQYWTYQGKPTLLLGGSNEDNLFQMPGLEQHLDTLVTCRGNYVRCTMSSRDEGNHWPFWMEKSTGLYDLNKWDDIYWQRFIDFLAWTAERNIIVQLEIWATFDFYRDNWEINPYNPKNNSTYSFQRTDLLDSIPTHPIYADNPFFTSIPMLRNNMKCLEYQQKFVDKILSYALKYDHLLYCMDNETSVSAAWGKFWADYIHKRALEEQKIVYCTEMWDPWDLDHIAHRETFDHPETYDFVEISQNNHHTGEEHWQNGLAQIQRLQRLGNLRPVTNIKIYGSDGGRHGGDDKDAVEKFCRNILFGASSARFHRPTSGIGLNATAQKVIQSMHMATEAVDFFNMQPLQNLADRADNEAYVRAKPGQEYLIYFTDGGQVSLPEQGSWSLQWLEVLESKWDDVKNIQSKDSQISLAAPDVGAWMAVMKKES